MMELKDKALCAIIKLGLNESNLDTILGCDCSTGHMRRVIMEELRVTHNKLTAILTYADTDKITEALDLSLSKYTTHQLCHMLGIDSKLYGTHRRADLCLELGSTIGERISPLMDDYIVITYLDGKLSHESIAEILGVSLRTVKNKINE